MVSVPLDGTTYGYIFRTDCDAEGWSYVGQSTRLDREHIERYYGSGFFIRQAVAKGGIEVLSKTILATAKDAVELHYLEMVHIAAARGEGCQLLNGDLGGPRPFPTMQQHLHEEVPGALMVVRDHERFHQLLLNSRAEVEAAIVRTMDVSVDDFYANHERDILAFEDLSHPCPSCGAEVGAVCRTNASKPDAPHNPCLNHKKRPRTSTA